jgi:tRNA A37 threonylcarbamoyltransferase TsaD
MVDCAMFNISLKGIHPSVICVEMDRVGSAIDNLQEVLTSEYPEESMQEFIESFARTDEVMPTDKTLGFVVANSEKKAISFSFANLKSEWKRLITNKSEAYRKFGYDVETDL